MPTWFNTANVHTFFTKFVLNYGMNILGAILILVLGYFAAKVSKSVIKKLLSNKRFDKTISKFVADVLYYIIIAIVIIAALSELGVQTSSFVALLGALTLAIGLSLKGSVSQFTSGLIVVGSRPFRVDDSVEIDGTLGKVVKISLMFTDLKTFDNQEIIIPNNKVLNAKIVNYTKNKTRRINIVIGIGYDDDIDKAREIMSQVAKADARVLPDPAPKFAVKELGDSSVNMLFRVWVNRDDYANCLFDFNEALKKAFDANDINIPYPQRDIHMITTD